MIAALVGAETVLLVLLIVLVAGLLRSHAEILRRLADAQAGAGDGRPADRPASPTAPARAPGAPAPGLAGPTPGGDAVSLDFGARAGVPTLLAFLTTGCATCAGFWDTLGARRLPGGVQTVVVTHGAERERPRRLRELAPPGIPVVMSSAAWADYEVPGSPYFVLVDGSIRGEGVATSWKALSSLIGEAIEDQRQSGPTARAGAAELALAAGGIGPEHPSLYPGRAEVGE